MNTRSVHHQALQQERLITLGTSTSLFQINRFFFNWQAGTKIENSAK